MIADRAGHCILFAWLLAILYYYYYYYYYFTLWMQNCLHAGLCTCVVQSYGLQAYKMMGCHVNVHIYTNECS